MVIIETPVFTRRIEALLNDSDYALLQDELVAYPERGRIIPGTGGLRKIRWSAPGRGKSGGIRVIYYYFASLDWILMLLAYAKNEQDNLTQRELKVLKKVVESELK